MSDVARAAARVVLVAVTVVCLLSMGGAMLFAFPVLVPLHWWAARRDQAGPFALAGWAALAASSMFEAGWMLAYLLSGSGWALAVGLLAAVATAAAFVVEARRRRPAPAPA